jgi:hypothetical protein
MGKKGSLADGTDAAHKLSWGLMNAVVTHTPGRPFGEEKRAAIAREMNSSDNLRIKSDYGNKTLDERRDARIAEAYVSGGSLRGGTTVERAYQILLDTDVAARVAALAQVVRRGGSVPANVTSVGARTALVAGSEPAADVGARPSTRSRRPWLIAAGIAVGTGVVAGGVALAFGLDARSASSELADVCAMACTSAQALALETRRDDASRTAMIAGVVGGVALVGGVVLRLVAPSAAAASSSGDGVAVELSARRGVVTYSWSY